MTTVPGSTGPVLTSVWHRPTGATYLGCGAPLRVPLPWQRVQQAVRAPSAWWTTRKSVGNRAEPPTQDGQSVHKRQWGSRQVPEGRRSAVGVGWRCRGQGSAGREGFRTEKEHGAPVTVGAHGHVFERASECRLPGEIKSIRGGYKGSSPCHHSDRRCRASTFEGPRAPEGDFPEVPPKGLLGGLHAGLRDSAVVRRQALSQGSELRLFPIGASRTAQAQAGRRIVLRTLRRSCKYHGGITGTLTPR
jgi:hypothetical protein